MTILVFPNANETLGIIWHILDGFFLWGYMSQMIAPRHTTLGLDMCTAHRSHPIPRRFPFLLFMYKTSLHPWTITCTLHSTSPLQVWLSSQPVNHAFSFKVVYPLE